MYDRRRRNYEDIWESSVVHAGDLLAVYEDIVCGETRVLRVTRQGKPLLFDCTDILADILTITRSSWCNWEYGVRD
jgi:hypothetical protein